MASNGKLSPGRARSASGAVTSVRSRSLVLLLVLSALFLRVCDALGICTYTCGTTDEVSMVNSCKTDCNVVNLCRSARLALALCDNLSDGSAGITVRAPLLESLSSTPQGCTSYLEAFIYSSVNASSAKVCPGRCCALSLPALEENLEFYAANHNVTATGAVVAFLPADCGSGGSQTFGFIDPSTSTVQINGMNTTDPLMILANDQTGQVCVYGVSSGS